MIDIDNATICSGSFCLKGLCFQVPVGEYAVLMGETGCGKSTLVGGICGLQKVKEGRVLLGGRDVTHLEPADRDIGYVPQDAALFPRMNVRQQIAFPLKIRNWSRADVEKRTSELAQMLGLGQLLHRGIQGLSGGEIQRVAIGRALSWRPAILILDEPFSALDEKTREEMYEVLHLVQSETSVTTLHVTHSSAEAKRLADCLFVFREGKVVRVANDRFDAPSIPPTSLAPENPPLKEGT